ncbi:ribonuclease J [Glaciecola petra]|uniref:Ribonuclease J n=1 Tax=Glaciecola petra TaxID=3075602 RepID=A0ABU2ZR42_9ALTE|nr:ribonuclease J [Aestuariibacter sp. P117]MDT0594064.1 ribonuclease J [Aestuariibacter sp. P117]
MLNKVPTKNDFWFLPLGGTGEIGMNVNLYGHNGQWIMIDCGVTFNVPQKQEDDINENAKRFPVMTADFSFITNRPSSLSALVLTHAHEDHIGAVIAMWPQLKCQIYATKFTAEVLRRKLYRAGIDLDLPITEVEPGWILDIGPFTLQWIEITHSIPESNALLITTPVSKVLHTGDWKIDDTPVVGTAFNRPFFKELVSEKIDVVVCDSTNALKDGYSLSEKACEKGLGTYISQASGRVVVTCFASNIARLVSIAKIAQASGRYICVLGPAIENMISIARYAGYWPSDISITPRRHIGYLPKHEVLIIASGSQGEPKASMTRLAKDEHRDCELDEGDTVIFSSIVIPGNEKPIKTLIDLLEKRKIRVVDSNNAEHTIHASGHPNREDLTDLFNSVRPKCVVPVHGEPRHLKACAEQAKLTQIPHQLTALNGDLYSFSPKFAIFKKAISAGRTPL